MRVNTNLSAILASRRLDESTALTSKNFERLSSGQRINRASDDAAGLSIATTLNANSRIYAQAVRNVNDGVSMLTMAQSALSELSNITVRQKELAEQAANGVYSRQQRLAMDKEANALVEEFNRIIASASFNGVRLFEPASGVVTIQAGFGDAATLSLDLSAALERSVGSGSFGDSVPYALPAGSAPEAAALADVNGDGKLDYITGANGGINQILIGLGNGDGTFQAPSGFATTTSPYYVAPEDFNGDGLIDLAVAAFAGESVVHYGSGGGSFGAPVALTDSSASQHLAVGDFDGDGRKDIASPSRVTGLISIYYNEGSSFSSRVTAQASGTSLDEIVAGDFNSDGRDDLAALALAGSTVTVFLSQPDRSFQKIANLSTSSNPDAIDTGDINNDGCLDLAVAGYGTNNLNLFLGKGDGTFVSGGTLTQLDANSESIELTDMNGDGRLDIVQGIRSTISAIAVFTGNGDGTFSNAISVPTGTTPITVVTGDVDGNGSQDLVAANRGITAMGVTLQDANSVNTEAYLSLTTRAGALEALDHADQTLQKILSAQGQIGSYMSRLEVLAANLSVMECNSKEAAGRITDVDVASETAQLVKHTILQQIGGAILAQANQESQIALRLLSF